MSGQEADRALSKRDLLAKLRKLELAVSAQATRAFKAERENNRLIAEVVRLRRIIEAAGLSAD